jgi:hypothetical protein
VGSLVLGMCFVSRAVFIQRVCSVYVALHIVLMACAFPCCDTTAFLVSD